MNDSIAKIKLMNATGEKILIGKWENGFEQKRKNLGIVIQSNIKITYYSDKQTTNILLLKVTEEGEKIIMSANKLQFEKEE